MVASNRAYICLIQYLISMIATNQPCFSLIVRSRYYGGDLTSLPASLKADKNNVFIVTMNCSD